MADAIIAYAGPVVTRKQAKADRLMLYFQGSACLQGHISQRYTRNGECVVCASDRQRRDPQKTRDRNARSKLKHRDKVLQRSREYAAKRWAENPEQMRERNREWSKANPEKRLAKEKRWREKNSEYVADRDRAYRAGNEGLHVQNRARVKAWRVANPDAYRAQVHLRRARKVGAEGSYGPEDVQRMLHAQNGVCNGCSAAIWKNYTIDHMTPLSRGGSNWPANLQLLCKRCNSAKNNRTMEEWLAVRNKDGTFKHRQALLHPHHG